MPKRLPTGVRRHTSRKGFEFRETVVDPRTLEKRRVSIYRRDLADLELAIEKFHSRVRRGKALVSGSVSLSDFTVMWLDSLLPAMELKPTTITMYETLARTHILASGLGQEALRSIRPSSISRFLNQLRDQNYSASLRRAIFSILRHLFRAAINEGLLEEDPMDGKVQRPKSISSRSRFLTDEETSRLLESLRGSRNYELVCLILATGLRRGEALGLTWSAVDFEGGQIHVLHTLSSDGDLLAPKSEQSVRSLDLSPQVRELLLLQRLRQQDDQTRAGNEWARDGSDLIFRSVSGRPLSGRNVLRSVQDAARKAGIWDPAKGSIGVHSLRHVAATKLLGEGIPMYVVSRVLGHESIETTVDIYGHLEDHKRSAAMAFLGDLIEQRVA